MAQSTLDLHVADETGAAIPFRAEWQCGSGPWQRLWSDSGACRIDAPAGPVSLLVRRGIDHDAAMLELVLNEGEAATREVVLRRRFDAKASGWWGGENHMHVLHDRSNPPATFHDGARLAAGDGLDYIQLAWAWDSEFGWPSAEELNRRAREATTDHVIVGWNIEAPKSYMNTDDGGRTGNLHCFGHGWTVGLKDNAPGYAYFRTGPNFRVIQEVNRQGGIVGLAHPVRFWLLHGGNFVSNWASEAPFDFVAGVPYAAVDVLNDSPLLFFESERYWYTLLNLGYKVAAAGNSDGAVGSTPGVGIYRTYAQIDGDFTWDKLAEAIKAGRTIATSGPFALFEVEGQGPGAEFRADGRRRKARIRAWSAPLPGERLVCVQLVRNGEVVRAWDLQPLELREWQTEFEMADDQFAWYCVRVLSSCGYPRSLAVHGPHVCELAVASAIYFLPEGFERPRPEPAQLRLAVTDERGQPLAASVVVHDGAGPVARHEIGRDGLAELRLPATASLVVSAPGFLPAERNLYMDCPELFDYCRGIATVEPSFFSPEPYRELRRRLGRLKLKVALQRAPG
jgi:hypothetical protein